MPAYYLEALTVTLGIILLMIEAFGPEHSKRFRGLFAASGLAIILVFGFFAIGPDDAREGAKWVDWPIWENFYAFDDTARFYKAFALVCTILVILMAIDYRSVLAQFTDNPESEAGTGEYFALPVFACAGMMWMASAKDLVGAFVALELVTVTFYVLVAYTRRKVGSLEAGVKYLILGALSTGFLVYGIAWVYGMTGTMSFEQIASDAPTMGRSFGLLFGIGLVLVGLAFKIGAVPMQMWIPDVYQGAPTPTTAFLSVGSKAAGFVLLIRFLEPFMQAEALKGHILGLLLIMAVATLLFGNLAALGQTNFKRLLAYSSIANAGFILLALAAWSEPASATDPGSKGTVGFYLATYLVMTLAAFFILGQVRIARDSEDIDAFDGLGKRSPQLAGMMTVIMASLVGIPLTAGFVGKFFVFSVAVRQGLWWGVGVAFIGAAAGFYYYFKVIRAMWWDDGPSDAPAIELPQISRISVYALTGAILLLGVWPQPILWVMGG
ncbi:NADH-quinone oxidoreductase subunit N [Haloferula sp. A504]|uniref:NADH-quinone oxidoreductase subunit N n=1 Tax=Haloferula sp. A504 TaxID=3373601 RepID=UPI0031C07C03|nr:NADH-quinone oxidoreductase subunit N [Verrucomicrobiaceae bacterium E54]